MPQPPIDPVLWAQFAAAALQPLVTGAWPPIPYSRLAEKRHAEAAREAAAYADALSYEWARRFLQEVK
jgi:hypothetical protein